MSARLFPPLSLTFASLALLLVAHDTRASDNSLLVDDFSHAELTTTGAARVLVDDSSAGSKSTAMQVCKDGVLTVRGRLLPGRGAPAFISVPLLVNADGQPRDLSGATGVRLRVKVLQGNLSVQVSTTDIDNFDYHTSAPLARDLDTFRDVRVPFKDMRRGWSEQVPINLGTVTSVNFVVFGMAPGEFAYVVDEVGFY